MSDNSGYMEDHWLGGVGMYQWEIIKASFHLKNREKRFSLVKLGQAERQKSRMIIPGVCCILA